MTAARMLCVRRKAGHMRGTVDDDALTWGTNFVSGHTWH
jgi:hypothetical protein